MTDEEIDKLFDKHILRKSGTYDGELIHKLRELFSDDYDFNARLYERYRAHSILGAVFDYDEQIGIALDTLILTPKPTPKQLRKHGFRIQQMERNLSDGYDILGRSRVQAPHQTSERPFRGHSLENEAEIWHSGDA